MSFARTTAVAVSFFALLSSLSPASAQNRRQAPRNTVHPVAVGAVVGTGAGVLVANSSGVASALGVGSTVGAGIGLGAVFGVGALILYCAIEKPHQECF